MLQHKKILVGVTGGIAAYKSADLIRRLRTAGALVRVAMTPGATAFITPLTLQAVSGHRVCHELLSTEAEAGMGHIELARWADFIIIAPASANFIARLTYGLADDLLTALCLATTAPIAVAPAMNRYMWSNPVTQENVQRLKQRGIKVFGPAQGAQACGDIGPGRMLEPEDLVARITQHVSSGTLAGQKVIITAGPTREAIDPIRYLTNGSSGKMGVALAQAAQAAGATVTLISGPTALTAPAGVQYITVTSAQEMYTAVMNSLNDCDIFIGAAAVADYQLESVAQQKIKKTADTMTLCLKRNPDIIKAVAALRNKPFVVGFAAETDNLIAYAKSKLKAKNLDMIVANKITAGQGFGSDENAVTIIQRNEKLQEISLTTKRRIAAKIIDIVSDCVRCKRSHDDLATVMRL